MPYKKSRMFTQKKKAQGLRFFISLIILALVIALTYAYLQGYRPYFWGIRKITSETTENMEENLQEEDKKDTNDKSTEDTGQPKEIELIVAPPVSLDPTMDAHLAAFREKAKALANKFPDTFILRGPIDEKRIALTFDDGPDNIYTPLILETLQEHKIKATFFLTGEQVKKYPETTKKIHEAGHQIGLHCWDHPRFEELSIADTKTQILKTQEIIDSVIGKKPSIIRPPYGLATEEQIKYCKDNNFVLVDWSIDSLDWHMQDENIIYESVTKVIHNGAIVLMHSNGGTDGRRATVNALKRIIPYLSEQGYQFTTVPELLGLPGI